MTRVLVADDHAGFRAGIVLLLRSLPGTEVVGEAASGDEAVVRAVSSGADVVLMDLSMPGGGGLAATERLARDAPHVAVLVLTMSAEDASVTAALRAGARGYLVKGASRAEVERALRTVAEGGVVVGASVAHRVAALVGGPGAAVPPALADLSAREREVLDLMARGLDNGEIARRLVLSPKTVRNVVSSIFGKLHTSDRVQVVLQAREAGLGPPSRDRPVVIGTPVPGPRTRAARRCRHDREPSTGRRPRRSGAAHRLHRGRSHRGLPHRVLTIGSLGMIVGGERPDGVAITADDRLAFLVHVPWLALGWCAAFVALLWQADRRPAAYQQAIAMLVGLYLGGHRPRPRERPGLLHRLRRRAAAARRAAPRPADGVAAGAEGISPVLVPLALLMAAPCTLYAIQLFDRGARTRPATVRSSAGSR